MYKPYRASLRAIWRELSRVSRKYPPLFHQRFSDAMLVGPDVISEVAFLAFQKAYSPINTQEWALWQWTPDGSYWGRFHGSENGLDEFERLAESAYLVLQEFDSELPEGHGVHGWLNVIHDMARDYPTPLLRTRYGVWGVESQPEGDEFDDLVTRWSSPDQNGVKYRPHPLFNLLVHNVFTSSMSAIELILDPQKALLVGDEWLDEFPVTIERDSDSALDADESQLLPDHSLSASVEPAIPVQKYPAPVGSLPEIKPVIEMKFDDVNWNFCFQFLGSLEKWSVAKNLKGFQLYKAILSAEAERKQFSSLAFCKLAGINRGETVLSSTGSVDVYSDDRQLASSDYEEDEPLSFDSSKDEDEIDRQGYEQIGKRIESLGDELKRTKNTERQSELRQEIEAIQILRSRSLNRHGKPRPLINPEEEKARKSINNRLKDARVILGKKMPRFAYFLDQAVRFANGKWSYDPRRATALLVNPQKTLP